MIIFIDGNFAVFWCFIETFALLQLFQVGFHFTSAENFYGVKSIGRIGQFHLVGNIQVRENPILIVNLFTIIYNNFSGIFLFFKDLYKNICFVAKCSLSFMLLVVNCML